ncbi:MAG: BamA/TamA family outer membrane protein [Sinobacteraceae bacterium]|nr:BamA/TamA family outer membrane protein [Nevskiaceae bacterium]MBV9317557.1 BamA/TamA family outer membrane protein [Gammaproteobacteria bacterium]
MAQRNFLSRCPRLLSGAAASLLCLLAAQPLQAASVTVEVRGVDDEVRDNVLAFLSFERFRRGGVDLNPDTVERLHNRVEREVDAALRPFGFYEPQVESTVTDQGRGDWRVLININPGTPVRVDQIDVRVDGPGENDPLFQRILRNLPLRSGDRLSHAAYENIKADLQRTAATYGYLDARLIRNELVVDPPNHTANIALELETGERYRFGETTIEQKVISDKLVRRYLRYHPGEYFDLTQVLRTQFALDDSQYFANLEVLPGEPDREALKVPVKIRADASRRHRYSVGGGYATDTGIRGTFGYEDRRINTYGHTLSIAVQASQVQRYNLQSHYRIPIGDPAVENISLNAIIQQETLADVTATTQSAGVSFTNVTAGWQHFWQLNGVHTISENSVPTVINTNTARSDELLVPELAIASVPKGFLGEPLFERPVFLTIKASHSALGSQADFVQLHLTLERVLHLGGKWHLLLRDEIGTTFVKDFNDMPAVYRFFAGGDQSVRGFAYNELSPLEGPVCQTNTAGQVLTTPGGGCQPRPGYYLKTGGKDVLTGTFEVIRELPRSLGVAAFFDYGNALNSFRKPDCVPGAEMGTTICPPFIQYSVGVGLRVRLPVMTLGVDIAQPLSTSGGPRLHINFSPKL